MDLDWFRYYTDWHHAANERQYDAPADPWRLVHVDPSRVDCYVPDVRLNWGLGRVRGGDWDREERTAPLAETAVYRGLKQRFEHGRDWEETALYRRAAEAFEERGSFRGYESVDEYRRVRCSYLDDLYHAIERDGYRPNTEAGHEKAADNAFEDAYANHLEPLVAIGRSGDVHWCEGYHRLTIASILDFDAIPVYVLRRHARWQCVRERVDGAAAPDLPPDLEVHRDHPDLQDVLE